MAYSLREKTESELQTEIEALETKRSKIRRDATNQDRGLTVPESSLVEDMAEQIGDLKAELKSRQSTGRPLTLQGFNSGNRSNGPFGSLGQQLMAIKEAGIPGGRIDQRLYQAAAGLNETTPSEGGFLLQQDFNTSLLQDVIKTSVLAPLCRKVPIGGNANGIKLPGVDETSRATGSRAGGVRGYWLAEAAEITASKPKFRQIELNLKKVACMVYTTDELLSDSIALQAYIQTVAPSELAFMLDDAIVNGSGTGQPLGILNAGSLVTVGKESGQAVDTVVAENIIKMESRMIGTGENAVWLANKQIKPQLYTMSIAVGTSGVPVYMPPGGLSGQPYPTLFGRPVMYIEQAAALGDLGDILYGDFVNGYILAEKGGVESAMSIHVRFEYDESVFRFILRVDGQPVRATALTPYKGTSNTESHFVTLEAR